MVIWWDWKVSQRVALMAAMLVVAAIPFILIGVFTNDWLAFLGGIAFLLILQIAAWLLFVGLMTGRMPSAYGRSELRAQSPKLFWITGAAYAGILLLSVWAIFGVIILVF